MANELKIRLGLWFEKGGVKVSKAQEDLFVTITGTDAIHATQSIGFAAAENLDKGDITTVGYAWFRNMDTTNFVQIGYDSTGFKPVIKLKAGEQAVARLGQSTPQAQADTGAVSLEYILVED
jgi:hypothetical protein